MASLREYRKPYAISRRDGVYAAIPRLPFKGEVPAKQAEGL